MGDMGDMFRDMKEQNKERRAERGAKNRERLGGLEYTVELRDLATVARVFFDGDWVDFWPSSGKWFFRDGERGSGFGSMIAGIRKREHKETAST